jgi:SET domain-containing protein
VNHSIRNANSTAKLAVIDTISHIFLKAKRDILAGEELLYDYGERRRDILDAHPWLSQKNESRMKKRVVEETVFVLVDEERVFAETEEFEMLDPLG